MKIDKVTRNHVQGLINKLYNEKNLSYSSVKKVYVALKSCYKHALIDGVVIRNPCDGISLPSPKERTKEVVSLTEDEVERLKEFTAGGLSNIARGQDNAYDHAINSPITVIWAADDASSATRLYSSKTEKSADILK